MNRHDLIVVGAGPSGLSAAIEANRDNPKLFRDAWEFTRAEDPAKPGVSPKRPPIPAAWR